MGIMINLAQFDILWIQFYNNDGYGCSAVNYTTQGALSNFNLGPGASGYGVRTYGTWVSAIAGGASKNAKLYIGLLGGPTASSSPQDWLVPADAKALIDAYIGTTNFGGVMLWEATAAAAVDMSKYTAVTSATSYWAAIKGFLKPYAPTTTVTSSTQVCTSTTSRSSSSTRTSSSTTTTSSSVRTTSTCKCLYHSGISA
jgi:chitinase